VTGSGYSGLSAALEPSRNRRNVTVVDALAFGEAASSRNGGGISAGVNIGKGTSGGPGQANREGGQVQLIENLLHESLAAHENVNTLIERESIECYFERRGCFVGAFTPTHLEDIKKKAEMLDRVIQIDAEIIPRLEQRREIGSDFYHGALTVGARVNCTRRSSAKGCSTSVTAPGSRSAPTQRSNG